MSNVKYVGLDVHQASTSVAVHDSEGKVLMQSTIRTTSEALRDFIRSLSGAVHLTLEEGTQAAWLCDLIKPLVAEVIVCDPRQNRLLKTGNKGDRVDANKLAHLLRARLLSPVYQLARLQRFVETLQCAATTDQSSLDQEDVSTFYALRLVRTRRVLLKSPDLIDAREDRTPGSVPGRRATGRPTAMALPLELLFII